MKNYHQYKYQFLLFTNSKSIFFLPALRGNRTLACQAVTRQLAADPVWLDLATQLVSYALLSELFMFT